MKQNNVKSRLKFFIAELGMKTKVFEQSIGASNGYVNSIVNSIGVKFLYRILEAYPQLNREWLLTGAGAMLRADGRPAGAAEREDLTETYARSDATT